MHLPLTEPLVVDMFPFVVDLFPSAVIVPFVAYMFPLAVIVPCVVVLPFPPYTYQGRQALHLDSHPCMMSCRVLRAKHNSKQNHSLMDTPPPVVVQVIVVTVKSNQFTSYLVCMFDAWRMLHVG